LDYYDCPSCMEMKEELFECPSCTTRGCRQCLVSYSKAEHAKNPGSEAKGIFKCMLCYKFLPQKTMHKFLRQLLNDIRFKCPDCNRVMPYEKLKTHKSKGECQKGLAS
jgi:hypothetical protein